MRDFVYVFNYNDLFLLDRKQCRISSLIKYWHPRKLNLQSMNQIKQSREFAGTIKIRQVVLKEMTPFVQKIEAEFEVILKQARVIRSQIDTFTRFEQQKLFFQKNIKEIKREIQEANSDISELKSENELNRIKIGSSLTTLKEEIHSMHRKITRKQQHFQNYEKKLNGLMETMSKHQTYIDQRMFVFEQKFKQLTKQTLEMTKDVKRDFNSTMTTNMTLKNELLHKIKHAEQKQKILDLYIVQREQIPKKLHSIYQDLKDCLRYGQFEEFKSRHKKAIDDSLSKAEKLVENCFTLDTQQNLKKMVLKFKQIDQVKVRVGKIDEIGLEIQRLNGKLLQLAASGDHKIAQIRQQTEEIQQKIIDVMDKKFQTIEQNIGHRTIQVQQTLDEKMEKFKSYFENLLFQNQKENPKLESISSESIEVDQSQNISKEFQEAKKERMLIEQHCRQIKMIAEGLNSKLSLFSNRITICRSDIEIFTQNTNKQLKKINDIKKQEQNHMQLIGKILSNVMESLFVLTSISINEERTRQTTTYVTYNDGIICEANREESLDIINYRRHQFSKVDLKQSLMHSLINLTDQIISSNTPLKWNLCKPSEFFKTIKQHHQSKSNNPYKSSVLLLNSSRKKVRQMVEDDLFFENKFQSGQNTDPKPPITINSTMLRTYQKSKQEMQKRYKIKRVEDFLVKQKQPRCFTASRSHRKSKMY